jgi:hypothetical protein
MAQGNTSSSVLVFISGGVSLLFGMYVLLHDWNIPSTYAFLIGMILMIIGVLFVDVMGMISLLVIVFGFYFFGRAAGVIDNQYLRYGAGIALTIIGFYICLRELANLFSKQD